MAFWQVEGMDGAGAGRPDFNFNPLPGSYFQRLQLARMGNTDRLYSIAVLNRQFPLRFAAFTAVLLRRHREDISRERAVFKQYDVHIGSGPNTHIVQPPPVDDGFFDIPVIPTVAAVSSPLWPEMLPDEQRRGQPG